MENSSPPLNHEFDTRHDRSDRVSSLRNQLNTASDFLNRFGNENFDFRCYHLTAQFQAAHFRGNNENP